MENFVQNKFNEFKSWYKSKTIIGLVISSISGVVFALSDGSVDIAGATNEALSGGQEVAESADKVISGVIFFVGQAIALWGRLKAKVGLK